MNKTLMLICVIACTVSAHAQYSWRRILPQSAFTIQVNALDPQKLYVGGNSDQLWRSNDGGLNWERILLSEFQGDNALSSVLVSSVDTGVVFIGGFRMNGIVRSNDGGRTTTPVLRPSTGRMWFISEAIVEDPSNPSTMYAARGSDGHTIYKSTDVGVTWDSVGAIAPTLASRLCTITVRPDSTNIIFVGARFGTIHRSDDAGKTFKQVPVLGDKLSIKNDSEIPKIVFSPSNPLVGYAVVAFADPTAVVGNGGLLKTTNGGASWDRVAYPDTSLWAVEVRPSSIGTDDVFIGGFKLNGQPSVIKGDSLIGRSLDGGMTWTQLRNISWLANNDGDTNANVWVLRYNKPSNKMYMATTCGLYVFDEPTGVEPDVIAPSSLLVTRTPDGLHVVDNQPSTVRTTWTLYDMQGAAVATGLVGASNELTLELSAYASGGYLMTWGTDTNFRTINFSIIR
ncbi:MAG: hypothetical protein SGJ05_05015 [bacterium]|nr:hypothetical protein [bacterium]